MSRRHELPVLVALALSACVLLPRDQPRPTPPFAEPTYETLAPDRPATRAEDVRVIDAFKHDQLPEGIAVAADHVELEPGMPTAADPHVTLGVVRIVHQRSNRDETQRDETQQQMLARWAQVQQQVYARLRTEAARHGANAVYIEQKDGNYGAQALYLSSATPVHPPVDQVLAAAERPHPGYTRQRQVAQTLDAYAPITIDGRRQECYSVVLALDRDARLADPTRDGLHVHFKGVDRELDGTMFADPVFAKHRWHTVEIGCPTKSGPLVVQLLPKGGPKPGVSLGTGHVVVQIYAKPISATDLDAMARRQADNWVRLRRHQCRECYRFRLTCGKDDPRDCLDYMSCLSQHGETYQTCEANE